MRCPVCRAENTEGPLCRRCRADLSLLFTLEEQRRRLLEAAAACAARGDHGETIRLAVTAHELRRGADSWRLLALGCLLQCDFALAWECYTRSGREPP
jgi:hypothetical protein